LNNKRLNMGRPKKLNEHPQKKKKDEVEAAVISKRRQDALDLRIAGASYRAIADRLKVSPGTAMTDVKAALEELADKEGERAAELRGLELHRLDLLMVHGFAVLQSKGATDGMKLKAIDRLVRITGERAKMLGLYMPQRIEHSGAVDFTAFLRELEDDGDDA
jgi:hypothetical protein